MGGRFLCRPARTIDMPCATASASSGLPASEREERRSSTRATCDARASVVEAADCEFSLELSCEGFFSVAKIRQRLFKDNIHRVRPPEQGSVGSGDLKSDFSSFVRIGGQTPRLLEVYARSCPEPLRARL
jgi:hypothetical protein